MWLAGIDRILLPGLLLGGALTRMVVPAIERILLPDLLLGGPLTRM